MIFVLTGLNRSNNLQRRIETVIEAHGGCIREKPCTYKEAFLIRRQSVDIPSVILLSYKAHQTYKYLLALATSTLTLHYRWIEHCIQQVTPPSIPSFLSPHSCPNLPSDHTHVILMVVCRERYCRIGRICCQQE